MFKKFGSFVEQEDNLWLSSTPTELLEFAAKLKTDLDENERKERVEYFIKLMGLEDCRHKPVGGIGFSQGCMSGGEKKRTSIAYELITQPYMCVLDEPTSGLDS